MIEERPKTAPNRPWMRARCWGGKMSASTVNAEANSMPPNSPWMMRKTISWFMSWEMPQSAEAATNPIIPAIRKGLRPKRSPILPAIGTTTVDATRYPVISHEYRSRPLSSATIRGSAVPTMVWSSAASSRASITPMVANTLTRVLSSVCGIGFSLLNAHGFDETESQVPQLNQLGLGEVARQAGLPHGCLAPQRPHPLPALLGDFGIHRAPVVGVIDPLYQAVALQVVDQAGDRSGRDLQHVGEVTHGHPAVFPRLEADEDLKAPLAQPVLVSPALHGHVQLLAQNPHRRQRLTSGVDLPASPGQHLAQSRVVAAAGRVHGKVGGEAELEVRDSLLHLFCIHLVCAHLFWAHIYVAQYYTTQDRCTPGTGDELVTGGGRPRRLPTTAMPVRWRPRWHPHRPRPGSGRCRRHTRRSPTGSVHPWHRTPDGRAPACWRRRRSRSGRAP